MPAYIRDRLAITFAVVALLALRSSGAWAQPTGTIKIVVPYTPGSLRPCSTGLRGRKQRRSAGWTYSYAHRYYAYGYPRYRAGPYGGYRPWRRW